MKREVQFVNSMTEKLKTQGDISKEEATRIFTLATVFYSYEMGWHGEGRYRESFNHRGFIISSPIEDALGNWHKEVFSGHPTSIVIFLRQFLPERCAPERFTFGIAIILARR